MIQVIMVIGVIVALAACAVGLLACMPKPKPEAFFDALGEAVEAGRKQKEAVKG